jgi:RNA polymerase sigma-70 factor (ECF subfamily)
MSRFDQENDATLVDLCNTGDRSDAIEAFETLYSRHKDYVLRVAFRYVRDADLALDVLQDTFSYILKKVPPPGPGLKLDAQLRTLLYVVAKNNAISILRKANKAEFTGEVDPDELPAPGYRDSSELAALMRGLTPGQQEIITLRFIDDQPLKDIAETLDIPLGTVKSRLHKAVAAMRKLPNVREFFDK